MEVARQLKAGIIVNGQLQEVPIRFLGLYDPVDSATGYGELETISANVETAAAVFASGTSAEVSVDEDFYYDGEQIVYREQISRKAFDRADHGPESAETDYFLKWILGTHAAIGGAPWSGDMPAGHNEPNDRVKAIESDQFVWQRAIASGVPINEEDDYGYEYDHPLP